MTSKSTALGVTQNAANAGVQFVNADGTTIKDVFVAGSLDSILKFLCGVTTDTSANNVQFYLYDGTTNFPCGVVRVTAGSGSDGATAATDMLNGTLLPWLSYDQNGKRVMLIKTGWKLRASVLVAVTAGKTLTLTPGGEDY